MATQTATSVVIAETSRIPGYGGFCPSMNNMCGKTYGNATRKFYESSRQEKMSTSRKPLGYSKDAGGISAATQLIQTKRPLSASLSTNPWTKPLPYSLHLSGRRRSDILYFNKDAQTHRDYYKDHSGLVQFVPGIRTRSHSAPSGIRFYSPSSLQSRLVYGLGCKAYIRTLSQTQALPIPERKTSARERSTRDVFFEKR